MLTRATAARSGHRLVRRGLVAVACLAATVASGHGAPAGAGGPRRLLPTVHRQVESDSDLAPLADGLEKVAVSSPDFRAATQRVTTLQDDLGRATRTRDDAEGEINVLGVREVVLTADIIDGGQRVKRGRADVAGLRTDLRQLAVANYVNGDNSSDSVIERDFNFERHNELGKQHLMVSIVNSDKVTKLRTTTKRLNQAVVKLNDDTVDRESVRQTRVTTIERRDGAVADMLRYSGELIEAVKAVEVTRHLAVVDDLGLPMVVLDAYVKAAQVLALEKPSCGIEWWALAGIGLTESRHGTSGGAQVRADGSLTRPILGIALDGSNDTAVVPGPGGFDRAQGPMQFISSTWSRWQRDGNGDGTTDIQNLYDAAAGAAAYLCAGGPMRTDADLQRGYFSYNHSLFYVSLVLSQARGYQRALSLP